MKRRISVLLVAVMILSLVPGALAAGGKEDQLPSDAAVVLSGSTAGDNEILESVSSVYIDGKELPIRVEDGTFTVHIPGEDASVMTVYTYNDPNAEDIHTQYPTGMKVWILELQEDGYTARYVPEFDNLLQYAGSSIRIKGVKGIRMITSVQKTTKAALTGKGLAGFTLMEYGTLLAQTGKMDGGPLVLGMDYAKSNYAYKKGEADPVFASTKDLVQYTNVLVGFNNEQCKEDIAMRPYMIVADADGNRYTIYGGVIYRSIGYIAWQNRTVFAPKIPSYQYVWEIIHYVYGDQYDADYKG